MTSDNATQRTPQPSTSLRSGGLVVAALAVMPVMGSVVLARAGEVNVLTVGLPIIALISLFVATLEYRHDETCSSGTVAGYLFSMSMFGVYYLTWALDGSA